MTKVAPSLLSCDFSRMGEELMRIVNAGADWAHLDIMDGMFVPNMTMGPGVLKSIRRISDIPFDVHLMIENPVRYVDAFADAGADMLTVHAEADGDIAAAVAAVKNRGLRAGVALNPSTDIHVLDRYLDDLDIVLIMSVNAGFGGQSFHPEVLSKIEYVRNWADTHNSSLEISMDGGINRQTGKLCVDRGATALSAGSALFGLDDMAPEIALWKTFGPNAGERRWVLTSEPSPLL